MKTNGKMGGYREYETYGESSLNDAPPFLLPDPTNPKLSKYLSLSKINWTLTIVVLNLFLTQVLSNNNDRYRSK